MDDVNATVVHVPLLLRTMVHNDARFDCDSGTDRA
jgi:hypothetical protein